ncbi:MAG: glycosyltransferase [Armatimonadota bacterium]|nr:glycosyltransferase [Armatimonadota bacterium]
MSNHVVLHVVETYLFITGSWIYSQVAETNRYRSIVAASKIENTDVFPFPDVYKCSPLIENPRSLWQFAANRAFEMALGIRKRKLTHLVHKYGAALIHAHFGPTGYGMLPLKRTTGLPLITAFYGADACQIPNRAPKWHRRFKKLFEEGDLFLAEGNHMKQTLISLGCPSEKVVVQHLGVNLSLIPFKPRRLSDDGLINIIVVGTFREKKGIPYALRAFARVASDHPNVRLTIVGDGRVGPELEIKAEILKIIAAESIADKVRITGYIPYKEFLREVEKAHICLAPSVVAADGDAEGGAPVCLIEMSASGLPVIASRHCDIPEVIIDGQSGFLVPERDVEALADRLRFLVNHPEIWESMAIAGRKHIEENYSLRVTIPRLEAIYDRLLQGIFLNK